MSLLSELNSILSALDIPVETGVFSGTPPGCYIVITPLADSFELFTDDLPSCETHEARLSLFCKGSYTATKNKTVRALLAADFAITELRYVGHEDDTGYHHYAIDVAKTYELEDLNGDYWAG
jgi:hypothetical protein